MALRAFVFVFLALALAAYASGMTVDQFRSALQAVGL
jgi:hypothetical protein